MKWLTKKWPRPNELRVRKAFAWWPQELSNGMTVWLEYYWRAERWMDVESIDGFARRWPPQWVTVAKDPL